MRIRFYFCAVFVAFITVFNNCITQVTCITCDAPFEDIEGYCMKLYKEPSEYKSYCDAQDVCTSIGGRLLTGWNKVLALKSFLQSISNFNEFSLGGSDLLHEKHASQIGWQFVDGSEVPSTGVTWATTYVNHFGYDDCLVIVNGEMTERICANPRSFVCEPINTKLFIMYTNVAFPKHGYPDADIYYCKKDRYEILNELYCALECKNKKGCVVFLFNKKLQHCRLMLHTDATVEAAIENNQDWVKYKMV